MTLLVHLLTAATIFVHATVGCCAHKAHEVSRTSGECCCKHADHEHDGDGLSQELPQPAPQECNHTDCKWPAPKMRNHDDLLLLSSTGILPLASSSSHLYVLYNGLEYLGLLPDASWRTLPVRAHLAKCVLLI